MSRSGAPEHCAVCGAAVPPKALACPACGADERTGWREPGTEALDVYSDWKMVYVTHDPASA